nr:MAG TPA: hypothetical protein [Caudoviricetes sp.]
MNTKKEVLRQLKRTELYFEKENMEAIKSIVDNCITILEKSIKKEDERTSEYIDDLIKDLK